MKSKSLICKLVIKTTSILAFILVIFSCILSLWFKNHMYNYKEDSVNSQSKAVASETISYLSLKQSSTYKSLKSIINIAADNLESKVLVADNIGYIYIVSDSSDEEILTTNMNLSEKQLDLLRSGEMVSYKKTNNSGEREIIYLKPVFNGNYFCSIISIIVPVEEIYGDLSEVNKIIWVVCFSAIAVFAVAIYYIGKKIVVNPIEELNIAARKLAKGEVEKRVEINTDDEISELGNSFNIIAHSLETVDKNRRDFISNVSHELRSPITSINGIISGIIDGIIPKDKEGYYLGVISSESKRLARLVNELLDISSMESGKFNLSMIKFDINVLIEFCLANMQGKIKEKRLQVEVVLENEYQMIFGDRDRIIQVITNLLDNAIKYTETGGSINIKSKVKGEKVHISIRNDGPCMTEEELTKIWDRFYKADKSRTNKESTGLGLPIVRLILTQHNEEIWVKNNKDMGVTFTFTLARV